MEREALQRPPGYCPCLPGATGTGKKDVGLTLRQNEGSLLPAALQIAALAVWAATLVRFRDPALALVPSFRLTFSELTTSFYLKQKPVDLTPAQFRLLYNLYQHAGEVCTRESCAQAIWGRDYDLGTDADALDRAMSNLRGQLRQVDPEAGLIGTRRGLGYAGLRTLSVTMRNIT